MIRKVLTIFLCLLFSPPFYAASENIRGPLKSRLQIGDNNSFTEEIRVKMEELFTLEINRERIPFVESVELEIKIPSSVRSLRDSFALFIYKQIYPEPDFETWAYTGEKVTFELLPPRAQIYYHLSLNSPEDAQVSPDTVFIRNPVKSSDFPLLLSILPVMKGIPSAAAASDYRIRARTVLKETGYLAVEFEPPDNPYSLEPDSVTLFIDGKAMQILDEPSVLTTGLHSLELISDDYRSQSIKFTIESGKTTSVSIPLQPLVPRLFFDGPSVAELFFDGDPVDIMPGVAYEVQEGEHVLLFILGDYRVSRKINVEKGKDYNISLFLDILVEER